MTDANVALASLCVTLLGVLILAVWRFATVAATLTATTTNLKDGLKEVTDALKTLQRIPVLESRVELVSNTVARSVSDIRDLTKRVARLNGENTGRFGSVPDIDGD